MKYSLVESAIKNTLKVGSSQKFLSCKRKGGRSCQRLETSSFSFGKYKTFKKDFHKSHCQLKL